MMLYDVLPGETAAEVRARLNRVEVRTRDFTALLDGIDKLAKDTHSEASAEGYIRGYTISMYSNLSEADQETFMNFFIKVDQELMMKKMSTEVK